MYTVKIKPLSVNQAWQGKRFKTKAYIFYEKNLYYLLPNIKIDVNKPLQIKIIFYFSNINSDWDNPLKPFVDVLQKKYDFNDNKIYKACVYKKKVKKGEEKIEFVLKNIENYLTK